MLGAITIKDKCQQENNDRKCTKVFCLRIYSIRRRYIVVQLFVFDNSLSGLEFHTIFHYTTCRFIFDICLFNLRIKQSLFSNLHDISALVLTQYII